MKLHIIKTNTTLEGNRGLIDRIKMLDKGSCQHIFVVPDRFTLSVEKEICERYCENGSFNIDVVSFTRLAKKTLKNNMDKCLSKEGTVILLNKILSKINCSLNYYDGINSYTFAKEMFASIASFRNSGITPEDLVAKAQKLEGSTKAKILDIATIYSSYIEGLTGFDDTITRIDRYIENLEIDTNIKDTHFYILGFNVLSYQQMTLIKKLIAKAKSLNIAFAFESGGENGSLFVKHQAEELEEYCSLCGGDISTENRFEVLKPPFSTIHKKLFSYAESPINCTAEEREKIKIFCQSNPYEEVKSVAQEIAYLIREEKYRYKDIAVACNDENYLPIIDEMFLRMDIPHFVEKKYFDKNSVIIKYLYILFDIFMSNCDVKFVLKLVKSPLLNFDREKIEIFENYCLEYNINYSRFLSKFSLGECQIAEEIRGKIVGYFVKIPKESTVKEYCEFIQNILSGDNIAKYIEENSVSQDMVINAGTNIDDYLEVIEDLALLNGESCMEIGDFVEFVKTCTDELGHGLLPQYIDSVFVGNTDHSRFSQIKSLFVVGASSGNFPKASGDKVILTALDCELMRASELKVFPTPIESNALEQFVVIDLVSKASDKLYVSYSLTNFAGEKSSPSEGVKELAFLANKQNIGGLLEQHSFTEEEKLCYLVVNPKNGYYEFLRKGFDIKYENSVKKYLENNGYFAEKNEEEEEHCDYEKFFFKKNAQGEYTTSISQLERYFTCPYKHFLDYGLKIRERKEGTLKPLDVGNIVHNILEDFFKQYGLIVKSITNIEEKINTAVNKEFSKKEYQGFFEVATNKYLLAKVNRETKRLLSYLVENLMHSEFVPRDIEVSFGSNGKEGIPLNVGKKDFILTGKVDRVDVMNDNVLVIDYKTGSTNEALKEVFYGNKIQLYMYLKKYMDDGYQPGGVFYLPTNSDYSKEGKNYSMLGQMLDNQDMLCAIDDRAKTISGAKSVKFSLCDKSESGVKKSNNAISNGDFHNICNYVKKLSELALTEIIEGYVEKSPYEHKCEYCLYKTICGEVNERKGVTVKAETFRRSDE